MVLDWVRHTCSLMRPEHGQSLLQHVYLHSFESLGRPDHSLTCHLDHFQKPDAIADSWAEKQDLTELSQYQAHHEVVLTLAPLLMCSWWQLLTSMHHFWVTLICRQLLTVNLLDKVEKYWWTWPIFYSFSWIHGARISCLGESVWILRRLSELVLT